MRKPTITRSGLVQRAYEAPSVVRYGDVEEITRSKQSCNSSDVFGADARGAGRNGDGDVDWLWCALS